MNDQIFKAHKCALTLAYLMFPLSCSLVHMSAMADVSPALDRVSISAGALIADPSFNMSLNTQYGNLSSGDIRLGKETAPRIKADIMLFDNQGLSIDYYQYKNNYNSGFYNNTSVNNRSLVSVGHLAGAGGFISISQNTQRVVFVETFCAGHLEVEVHSGHLKIMHEAGVKKFVAAVEQITFNGPDAVARHQDVLYVTERCVFRLTDAGPELIEIAPGIDLQRDILAQMDFLPKLGVNLRLMDKRIFHEVFMSLRNDMLAKASKRPLVAFPGAMS